MHPTPPVPPTHPTGPRVTVHAHGTHQLAEGARWVDDRLIFTDILTGRLLETRDPAPAPARELLRLPVPLGAVAPLAHQPGHWIAAAGTGIALLAPEGTTHWLARPEDHTRVPTRMNDGACDPHGRFWAGSMPYDNTPGAGNLYRTDHDGTVHHVLDGLTTVNGPAFTPDGHTLYLADSATRVIHRCTLDPHGNITHREKFTRTGHAGTPDGMTVDHDHHLWVALWGGSAIHRYHPDGTLTDRIHLPTPQPTSVCLTPTGTLLITTARHGLTTNPALAGSILTTPVNTTAPPATPYTLR
ncbi:SMP-30/gluconolactonase/LRE family protein [Kitasatospora sp. NPDC058201]|uniref:SMP-30/gluconolactonase/LRE family protein n=1 Tax=unclassified Kitasatospora TaxID=2633591 RepID=UPI003669A35E